MNSPDTPDSQRLSKAVAALVPCSRREAEQYIAEGWVRVDGRRVEEPQFRVTPGQRVEVDTQASLQPPVPATFLLHKPAGATSERARALLGTRGPWTELMPLPVPAGGLAVFSQNRGVIRKLQEDAALVEQELVADVNGAVDPERLARLSQGGVKVSRQSEQRLRIAGKGLDLEAVPALCARAGLELTALRRIRLGRIAMAGLPVGQSRMLEPGERF